MQCYRQLMRDNSTNEFQRQMIQNLQADIGVGVEHKMSSYSQLQNQHLESCIQNYESQLQIYEGNIGSFCFVVDSIILSF